MTDLLHTLLGKTRESPSKSTPVWFMRQAGRYLPEYRKIRQKHSLVEMFKTPDIIVEVTQQPIDILGVDAAILFADILHIADAFGLEVDFIDGKGPVMGKSLPDPYSLTLPNIEEKLSFVFEAIKTLRKELKVPLIGFAGAPFTVASYMIEEGSSSDRKSTRQYFYRDRKRFECLLEKVTESTIQYLDLQIAAGVQVVQLFESWGHILPEELFEAFSLRYLKKIVDHIQPKVPVILFGRGSSLFYKKMESLKSSAISLDWQFDLLKVKGETSCVLQGNLDPCLLYGSKEDIAKEVKRLKQGFEDDPRFILNLGHGLLPDTPVDAVKWVVELAHG